MENVRGILSSKLNDELIFPKILKDLSDPFARSNELKRKHRYKIFSVTTASNGHLSELKPSDFLIHAERYGVPQARHRVILVGVRDDMGINKIPLLFDQPELCASKVLDDLPKLTPGLSKENGRTRMRHYKS